MRLCLFKRARGVRPRALTVVSLSMRNSKERRQGEDDRVDLLSGGRGPWLRGQGRVRLGSVAHAADSWLILYTATHDGLFRIPFVCIPGGWSGPVHQAKSDCVFGG